MRTVEYRDGAVWLIDQTRLPLEAALVACRDHREVADAIVTMKVRGAPAIGVTAGYGVALAARELAAAGASGAAFRAGLAEAMERLGRPRPTAGNPLWAPDPTRRPGAAPPGQPPRPLA